MADNLAGQHRGLMPCPAVVSRTHVQELVATSADRSRWLMTIVLYNITDMDSSTAAIS